MVGRKEFFVEVGQLNGVSYGFDLSIEAANLCIGDVWNFFEDEVISTSPGEQFHEQARTRVDQDIVPTAQAYAFHGGSEFNDSLVVSAHEDQRTVASVEELIDLGYFTGAVCRPGENNVEGLVEDYLGSLFESEEINVRTRIFLPPERMSTVPSSL